MTEPNVLRTVDDDSRRLAKSLIRKQRYGSLACLDPASGHPLASQVNVSTDTEGRVCFLISQLSAHYGALEADARCSILLGTPGKGDPAAHARITIVGDAERLADGADRNHVRQRFLSKHPKSELYADFPDFAFWRITPVSASLNGGFGKAYAMQPRDLLLPPDQCPGISDMEADAVAHMNSDHSDAVRLYATVLLGERDGNWRLTCLDPEGLDLALDDTTARLWLDPQLTSVEQLRPRLVELAQQARGHENQ
ncbi:MAG: HugZ family protein [Hyphomicrobiaceae bacterium]